MEGLRMVARESLTRMGGRFSDLLHGTSIATENEEAAYAFFADFLQLDEDERNWSIPHLRRQLRLKDSRRLFRRYQMRVQHTLFVELLLLNLIVNGIMLVATASYFFDYRHGFTTDLLKTLQICRGITVGINFITFVVALFRERWFIKSWVFRTGSALLILATMVIGEMGPTAIESSYREPHQETSAFYIVLTSTVLLPFSRKLHGAYAALLVATVDLTLTWFTGYCRNHHSFLHLTKEGFYLFIAMFTGLSVRYFMEIMGRRAFLDRWESLESNIKCENEKEREDRLLHSVLPLHIAHEFRDDFRGLVRKILDSDKGSHPITASTLEPGQPFNKLYVERYTNVSILYADIVNSMLLCASLQAADLVNTLDDLFGRFDRVAEINNCMRIKLLGDCYYCVSGLPVRDKHPNNAEIYVHHADDCVRTGILMILIIKEIREKRGINVDMRIGVHSGRILGGLLGLKKWQYDVWSRDVTIASHMEQAGFPGHVHITSDTKDLLVEDYGEIQPVDGHHRDLYLAQEGIRTFLISPNKSVIQNLTDEERIIVQFQKRSSMDYTDWNLTDNLLCNSRYNEDQQASSLVPKRRRAVLDYSLVDFHHMIDRVNEKMEVAIDRMELGKKDQWCADVGVNPAFLTFKKWKELEHRFFKQPDPLYKNYLACCLFLFFGIVILQLLTLLNPKPFYATTNSTKISKDGNDWYDTLTWSIHGLTFVVISTVCLISWIGYLQQMWKREEHVADATSFNQPYFLKISRHVWKTTCIRLFLWTFISATILACSLLGFHVNFRTFHESDDEQLMCEQDQWLHTACVTLALTGSSVFIRIHYLLKLLMKGAGLAVFCVLRFIDDNWFSPEDAHHSFYVGLVIIILHMLDRQIEYVCRLDYVWRWKLSKEREEVRTVELVNQMLLNNILPKHVKQHFLSGKRVGAEVTTKNVHQLLLCSLQFPILEVFILKMN